MTDQMNRERRSLYSDWISQSCHDQRSLFRKANTLLGLRQQQILPPHADKAALSQELANTSPTCTAMPTILRSIFLLNPVPSEESAFSAIQSCISAIRSWLLTNKLLVNDTKTEFLIIGTRQQLYKVRTDSISVGESRISSSKEVRNLGTWLDNTLSMSTQVSKVASSCFYYIYNIRRIRKYLSREVCETLVNSLITSRLDYCNSLLYGCPSSLLARLPASPEQCSQAYLQCLSYLFVISSSYQPPLAAC